MLEQNNDRIVRDSFMGDFCRGHSSGFESATGPISHTNISRYLHCDDLTALSLQLVLVANAVTPFPFRLSRSTVASCLWLQLIPIRSQ